MAINKVIYGNDTLVDLTGDTVDSGTLLQGVIAHNAAGVQITGTATIPLPAVNTPEDLGTAAVGSSSRYALEDHVHNMPSASDVGAVSTSEVQYKMYDSVTDLGLTSGSATISGAVTALIAKSPARLFCNSSDFASTEVPNQYGEVEIVALATYRVAIWFYGQTSTYPDRRMYLSNGTPTGTWVIYRSELDEKYTMHDSVADIDLTSGSATISGAYAALPNRGILMAASDQFASGQASGALVIMIKRSPAAGAILNLARAGNIYHQPLNSNNEPTGTWTRFTETSDFVTEECTGSTGSISAGGNKTGSITITKSGYTPIAIAGFNSGNTWLVVSQMYISSSTTLNYTVRNVHASSSGSGTVSVNILYRKN